MAHIFLYELQDFPFRAADKIRRLEYAGIGERGRAAPTPEPVHLATKISCSVNLDKAFFNAS